MTIALTIAVFVINLILGRPLLDALLFSLALAMGVTPQMRPAIVSVSLSAGARTLSKHQVIVKRLDVSEDLGSLTVLCTDKTGTLTGENRRVRAGPRAGGQRGCLHPRPRSPQRGAAEGLPQPTRRRHPAGASAGVGDIAR